MRAIKGPAVFLAQFAGDAPPFNSLAAIAAWAARLGFKGVQIPSWDRRLFDREKADESQTYCDDVRGVLAEGGLQVTELSTHLQGQLVAVHPAYDTAFDGFAAQEVRGKPQARTAWAVEQLKLAAATGGSGRDGVRRACAALAADSRRVRRSRRQPLLRDPSR